MKQLLVKLYSIAMTSQVRPSLPSSKPDSKPLLLCCIGNTILFKRKEQGPAAQVLGLVCGYDVADQVCILLLMESYSHHHHAA